MPENLNETGALAHGVGVTATLVAAARARATRAPQALIDDSSAAALDQAHRSYVGAAPATTAAVRGTHSEVQSLCGLGLVGRGPLQTELGWGEANNKRIRRLWREEGLRVPQRRKKKRPTGIGVAVGAMSPIRPNVIWAMDFPFDTTAGGRILKMLNVIDEFTREAHAIEVDRAIDADGIADVLDASRIPTGPPNSSPSPALTSCLNR